MTPAQWNNSSDPLGMLRWLETQNYSHQLWQFAIGCCRRVWDQMPDEAIRNVVRHAEAQGIWGIDTPLTSAHTAMRELKRRIRMANTAEIATLNRQVGHSQLVFVFEYQDGFEAARDASQHLIEWAADRLAEARTQADMLRSLIADPSEPCSEEDLA